MTDAVLEMRDIRKDFGALEVLKGITVTADRGEVVSLIGSSGSGKSTLLRCANLLELCHDGDIIFKGEAVRWKNRGGTRSPADAGQIKTLRCRLAMVFQQFNLWAHMTVLDNVMEAPVTVMGRARDATKALAMELLDKVGIADKAASYPAQLSGGQQQRAAIARALAMEPDAMLLDEPTSALDPELEQEVARVIRSLADEGRTMLLVTHDMRLARDVSKKVVFLHEGKVEAEGPPELVLEKPDSGRLKQFLNATH